MKSLLSPVFLLMVVYGVLAVPIYIGTVAVVLRGKNFKTTFFHIYFVSALVNIVSYLNKFIITRLPLFTCGTCFFAEAFSNTSYWWLTPALFIQWHTHYLQCLFSSVLALDRFIVIVMGPQYSPVWTKVHAYVIAIVLLLPLVKSYRFIGASSNFEYLPQVDDFRVVTSANLQSFYYALVVVSISMGVVSLILNLGVFFFFRMGKIKLGASKRNTEMKLFFNSVTDIATEIVAAVFTFIQGYFLSNDAVLYDNSRIYVAVVYDILGLLPPFVLILTSRDVRRALFPCIFNKTVTRITPNPSENSKNTSRNNIQTRLE